MLLPNGIWLSSDAALSHGGGAALVLDRDGVLIEDVGYISRPQDVRLEPGAVEIIRRARAQGLAVVTVTNQSGIARGCFDWKAFEAVEQELARRLAAEGVGLDLTIACSFHPEHTPGYGPAEAHWRKPGPGMIELAAIRLDFDPAVSWMIGDKASDVAAARNARLAGAVHVLSGHGNYERDEALGYAAKGFSVLTARNLAEARLRLTGILLHR